VNNLWTPCTFIYRETCLNRRRKNGRRIKRTRRNKVEGKEVEKEGGERERRLNEK
jgi:hypothetical protein